MIGNTLGSYSIQRELGRGGMGAVYMGTHALLGRQAAVKVLLPELSRNQDIVQRFFNEARAATAIRHPGIVEIYDFGYAADGSAYIVMEYLDGETLSARLRRFGRLAAGPALGIARQVASALAAAHRAGIVHRDLKPDNVFLVPDAETAIGERVKLLDFGIAKLAHGDAQGGGMLARTSTGAIMGTPYYMSPEQCKGAGQVDARSDLYSLGCMMFEMVCGRVPFVGEGGGEIIAAHIHVPAPYARELAPELPLEVEALIARLMAKKPEERPQSADQVAQEISVVMTQLGLATSGQLGVASHPPTGAPSPSMPTPPPVYAAGTAGQVQTPVPPASVAPAPTTLGNSVGQSLAGMPVAKKRTGLWIALAILVLGGGAAIAAVVATSGGGDGGGSGSGTSARVTVIDAAAKPVIAIDAGAKPVIAIDAAPVPSGDRATLLAKAQQAASDEDWQQAGDLAHALLALDATDQDAQALVTLADLEEPAAAAAKIITDAQTNHDYDAAIAAAKQIPDASIYHAKMAPVLDALEKQDLADSDGRVDAEAKKHECSDAKRHAGEVAKRWGAAATAAITKAAKACKDATVTPPTPPDAGVPPTTGDPTVSDLVDRANQAAKAGQYGKALKMAQRAAAMDPGNDEALTVLGLAACNLKRAALARQVIARLSGQRASMLKTICVRNNVNLDDPQDPLVPQDPPKPNY